jgi:hypothetical protein
MILESLSGSQSIAGEDIVCSRIPKEIELARLREFLGLCAKGGEIPVVLVRM